MAPISSFYTPGYARLNALEPRELPRDHGGVLETRRETLQLLRQAIRAGRLGYVLVNSRVEENASLTMEGSLEMLLAF